MASVVADSAMGVGWLGAAADDASKTPGEFGSSSWFEPVGIAWDVLLRSDRSLPAAVAATPAADHGLPAEWRFAFASLPFQLEWGADAEGSRLPFEWGQARRFGLFPVAESSQGARPAVERVTIETIGAVDVAADALLPIAADRSWIADGAAAFGEWLGSARGSAGTAEFLAAARADLPAVFEYGGAALTVFDAPLILAWGMSAAADGAAKLETVPLVATRLGADEPVAIEILLAALADIGLEGETGAVTPFVLAVVEWLAGRSGEARGPAEALAPAFLRAGLPDEARGVALLVSDRPIFVEIGLTLPGAELPFEIARPPRIVPITSAVLLDRTGRRRPR